MLYVLLTIIGIVVILAFILDVIICRKYYDYLKTKYIKKYKDIKSPIFISFYLRGVYRDNIMMSDDLSQDKYMKKLINYARNLILLSGGTIIVFGAITYIFYL